MLRTLSSQHITKLQAAGYTYYQIITQYIELHTSFLAFRRQNRGILLQTGCCRSSAA